MEISLDICKKKLMNEMQITEKYPCEERRCKLIINKRKYNKIFVFDPNCDNFFSNQEKKGDCIIFFRREGVEGLLCVELKSGGFSLEDAVEQIESSFQKIDSLCPLFTRSLRGNQIFPLLLIKKKDSIFIKNVQSKNKNILWIYGKRIKLILEKCNITSLKKIIDEYG